MTGGSVNCVDYDVNWLYSAIAQSSAAIIGLGGGLYASRLIGLATEKSSLEREVSRLEHSLELVEERFAAVDKRREAVTREGAIRYTLMGHFRTEPHTAFDYHHVFKSEIFPDTVNELEPIAVDCLRRLSGKPDLWYADQDGINRDESEIAELLGIEMPPGDGDERLHVRFLIRDVVRQYREVIEKRVGIQPDVLNLRAPTIKSGARNDELLRELREIEDERETIEHSLERVRGELASRPSLASARWMLAALAVLAVFGLAVPVALMALWPVPDSVGLRRFVVITAGLSVLGVLLAAALSAWRMVASMSED